MDQQTDTHYMTREFLESQIVAFKETLGKKDALILSLQERSSEMSNNVYRAQNETQSMRDAMHEWTINELRNEDISESQAEAIAEICGFDLTKEVEVEVTVTYNLTVQCPYDEDPEDIVNDIDFDAITYDMDKITWVSSSIDRIDI
jgi:hypothetical protein